MDSELRVFVVDDDPGVLRALERLLRSSGFQVEVHVARGVSRAGAR
jgi:FixJ family two-component response regulator